MKSIISFLGVPGVSCDENVADETDSKAGRHSRLGMSSEAGQYLSGDEDILAGSPKMEDSIYSSSPAMKLETNRIDKDNTSTISSVKLGDCAGSDNNTSQDDCVSNNQVVDTTNINNSPRDDEIFNGPMLDNVDEITSEDKAPHTQVLDQTSDVEYSSNYEEDEESDIDNTKSLQNRTTTDNNGMHGNNKPPGGDKAAISNDVGTSSVRIQNVDSCSEKNENSYNSNNYESDEYEDLTDSDNTDYETDSDTPTKSPFLERKEIVREQNMELQSSLPSKDFLDHSQLQSNHTDSIEKQSHLNITVNDIHSIHSVSRSDHSDPNDTSKDDDQSVQHHGGYNTDRDSHGEESSEYDDDFDSESDHSSNENEPKNKSNSKTMDEPVVNDFEKKFNHQSNSFDVTDREVDKSDNNFRPSKAYATHVDQPAGLVKQTPDTATSSNKENDRSRRFHNSTISNRIEKETVHTHKARILPEDTSSGGGKHNHVSKTTKPISPRSASVTKVSNVQNRNVKKKILRRRSGSLPNKIKENIPVPSRQNLYKAPKDIIVQYSNDSKQEQAKSIRRAPLPLITKQSEKKNMEKEYMNLKHSRVESLVQENKVPFEEDRIPHLDKTLKPNMSELQQRTLSAKPNTHIPNVSSTVNKTNIQHISGSKPNQIKPLPMTRKSRNKTDVTDQLININNQCYKGKDLVKQDDEIRTLEMSLSSTADMPGSNNPDKDDTSGTGREAQYSSELAIDVPNTSYECNPHKINIGSNKTNGFELASQDIVSKTPAQEFVDLKSEERTHNQYSISTASNLTMSGNDSFKSVTDKTNRTENFITGNELITPLASHEKQEENNHYAIKLKGEAIKDSAVGCASSESQESTDSMEDTSDSNVVKHKGYRQRPLNRNLYRSHTRPRHITTKADNKLSKYGLERPSSPFIFSGTKSYIRQSSLTSELHTFSEDGSSDDFHERRKAKTGLADIARLRDIRRQLRLPEEINVNPQPELTNVNIDGEDTDKRRIIAETKKTKNGGFHSSAAKETEETVMAILNDVIGIVSSTAKQPQHILQRRCITTNTEGEDELCCILQPPNFIFNLFVVQCDIIDVNTITPVTKTRHETLLSNIIKIASPDSGEMGYEAGLVAHLPVKDFYIQSWQEPVVRVYDCNGNWTDVEGTAPILHVKDGGKKMSVVEVHITKAVTLAVIARPILDKFDIVSSDTKMTSSLDSRIEVCMGMKQSDCPRSLLLQTVPVDVHTLTWFSKLHSDDEDYQILSCSPLVTFQISDQHTESVQFKLPYVSLYSRPPKKSIFSFSTSCVHSPIPRIPSPYRSRQTPGARLKQVASSSSRTLDTDITGTQHTLRRPGPMAVNKAGHLKRRSKVHIPSGEKHLVILKEGPGKTMKIVSLSKVTDVTCDAISFTIYDNSCSAVVIETRTGLQYTSIGEVTKAFAEFVSLKKVNIKVYQTLSDVQTLHVDFEACYTKTTLAVDEAAYYSYSQTELLLNEGDVIGYSFNGNIRDKKKPQAQFCYYSSKGFQTTCLIDVHNPYGQRSLPAFHGVIQLYSMSEARVWPVDVMTSPDFDEAWECIIEIPVTLPKVIAKVTSTVSKAPLALELEEPLTPDFMRLLCRDLRNDWERFAKELRIGRARIQSIKQQNKNTIPEKIVMDILANWLKRQPKVDDKASPLISALKRCNKWQLATELEERQKTITALRSETVEDILLQKAILLVCKSLSVSRKWRQLFYQLNSESDVTEEANEIEAVHVKETTCCRLALCRWKDRTERASVWTLVDALRAIRCNVVADAILSKYSKKRKPTRW